MADGVIKIEVDQVRCIHNLGADGVLFDVGDSPSEHVKVSFVEALIGYCDAVDQGLLSASYVEDKKEGQS